MKEECDEKCEENLLSVYRAGFGEEKCQEKADE
jgi:hypothetical protein